MPSTAPLHQLAEAVEQLGLDDGHARDARDAAPSMEVASRCGATTAR
jgi:hypothetical protein